MLAAIRIGCLTAALLWAGVGQAATTTITTTITLGLIEQTDAPALERTRLERAYLGHPGGSVQTALALALEDARFDLEASKAAVSVVSESASSLDSARNIAIKLEKSGAKMLVLALPGAWVGAVAAAVKVPVLNVAAPGDHLRGKGCVANLFHVIPSARMRADALAQALASRKWAQVLLLAGPSAEDNERKAVALAAMKRYGLKVVAERPFKLSADPRERQMAHVPLLTAGTAYDAVWVVDSEGEFARTVPYNTALARPVVGDAGLVALAWHGQFERFGAPQVNRRFVKLAKRPMTDPDWAAWVAGRAASAAVSSVAPNAGAEAWRGALLRLGLDGSKGVNLQFRPWDRQLRQPLLLSDGQGVQATAPVDGLLHPRNVLDTLGADEAEKLCP